MPSTPAILKKRLPVVAIAVLIFSATIVSNIALWDTTWTWTVDGDELSSVLASSTPTRWDDSLPDELGMRTSAAIPATSATFQYEDGARDGTINLTWQEGLTPTSMAITRTHDAARTSDRFEIAYDITEEARNPCIHVEYTLSDSAGEATHVGVVCAGQYYGEKDEKIRITALRKIAVTSPSSKDAWVTDYSLFARAHDTRGEHTLNHINSPHGKTYPDRGCEENSYMRLNYPGSGMEDHTGLRVYKNVCVPYNGSTPRGIEGKSYTGMEAQADFPLSYDTRLEVAKEYSRNYPNTEGVEWNDIATFEITNCTLPADLSCNIDNTAP
ncbi:hypothetical protein [Haloglycomyces albus]|uniref:hypothetical protein n=1 Tax=Haloglycomyces albus TaxID=526067 RepID=UPI00046D922E|nr:hypothetical protein [Haloglycomyces albus]